MKSISCESKELYWKRIQLISFVLALFIIIRHNSSLANYDSPLAKSLYESFKGSITEIAVPLFFLISGFNYFNNFTITDQKRKIFSRIKSLLVPYLSWNTIYCAFCVITSVSFLSQYFVGREKFIVTPLNVLLGCIFHYSCNNHFWFVFDLMICVLLNPIIFFVLRKKIVGLSFISVLFVAIICFGLKLPTEIFYRTDAFLYYYIGALLGLHCNSFFFEDKLWKTTLKEYTGIHKVFASHLFYFVIGILCMSSSALLLIPDLHGTLCCLIILISAYGFWKVSACCRYIHFRWLPQGGTIFLMYAAHGIIQPIIVKLLYLVFPKNNWIACVCFILSVLITVLFCVGLRFVTKRFLSPVDKVLTGWRK